jgi:hypothetical protein
MHEVCSTGHTTTMCGVFKGKKVESKKGTDPDPKKLEEAKDAVLGVQVRLSQLAGSSSQEQRLPSP